MDALRGFLAPTRALHRLDAFLRETGSKLSTADAAAMAINQWIASQRGQLMPPQPTRGYQWKSLFLPEGTELRITREDASHYARVEGDDIIYHGRPVSPRQMTIDVAGEGRNAWREIRVLLPGERTWRPASALRRQAEHEGAPRQVSPAEAMQAAAACMAETLKTALALVEHANDQALPVYERRVPRLRRAGEKDQEDGSCGFE